jgi:predicted metal-dependent phosphoesterase TrpH/glycosyltransferase involved in cell wall biosynthesis
VADPLAIAQVTPFAWEVPHEVNDGVASVSRELASRGHRVLIIAPSESRGLVRDTRRAIRSRPEGLLERAESEPLVLGVGEVLPISTSRRRMASLPVDVARTIEELLGALPLDLVHLHEPIAPSASSVALRHSRALNVGSFHLPTERLVSTQLARPLARLLFGRLDARIASYQATADLLQSYFPGHYDVIRPGADPPPEPMALRRARPTEVRIVACGREERAALRTFLRALRALPTEAPWHTTVWSPGPLTPPGTLSAKLRERIDIVDSSTMPEIEALRAADVLVLGSEGLRPAPDTLGEALAAGVIPVASRLAVYEELLGEGRYGLEFEPGDAHTLAQHLARLIDDVELRDRLRDRIRQERPTPSWSEVADQLEAVYGRLTARRRDPRGNRKLSSRLSARRLIDVDLHMHTDHSYDCATPVEVLLAQATARGLGAIAITDHNEISGALEARAKADGVKVIVAEEIKTADQGEVIGLFIEKKIPRGLTLERTIAEIKRQGGLVYVPHPFDRLHSVPDYEHLLDVLDDVDAIEVFNPRVAISEFNEEAVRFAAKYRIPAGAGSDAHVPQGLGSVRIRMREFDGPQEFLQALREADIIRNPASLLYVQALKFLQTKALPAPARRAARERRVRRATGRSAGRGAADQRRKS